MVICTRTASVKDWMKEAKAISKWLRDYCDKNGITSLVLGVSGGIDSAVCASICAMTGLKCIFLSMPTSSHKGSTKRAAELAVHLDKHVILRPIGEIIQSYEENLIATTPFRRGNLAARIRANILYDYASANNGIVVGTDNYDEHMLGYFTKGGDGLADIFPIATYHKSGVRELAKVLPVPRSIIDAAPSAELVEGQTDESDLGMTYDEVEWALDLPPLISGIFSEKQKSILSQVDIRIVNSRHKRNDAPCFFNCGRSPVLYTE